MRLQSRLFHMWQESTAKRARYLAERFDSDRFVKRSMLGILRCMRCI